MPASAGVAAASAVYSTPAWKTSHHPPMMTSQVHAASGNVGQDGSQPREDSGQKRSARKSKMRLVVNVSLCKYPLVHACCRSAGFSCVTDNNGWDLMWMDQSVAEERVMQLLPFQKLNHFPGMSCLSRKTALAKLLRRMKRVLPDEFSYHPASWILPSEANEFRARCRGRSSYIIKPDGKCQGKGIYIVRNADDWTQKADQEVAQKYVDSPLLIDGIKFDLRLYVLVVSVDPLRIFLARDGLARFCTEPFNKDPKALRNRYMHLTNYAINKRSSNFVPNAEGVDDADGSKRSVSEVMRRLAEMGVDVDALQERIDGVVVKTLLAAQPSLARTYRSCLGDRVDGDNCFELLGIDILIDSDLQPWLLEINHSPSLHADSPLDRTIKQSVISEALQLIRVTSARKKAVLRQQRSAAKARLMGGGVHLSMQQVEQKRIAERTKRENWESKRMNVFRLIYPASDKKLMLEYNCVENAARRIGRGCSPSSTVSSIYAARDPRLERISERPHSSYIRLAGLPVDHGVSEGPLSQRAPASQRVHAETIIGMPSPRPKLLAQTNSVGLSLNPSLKQYLGSGVDAGANTEGKRAGSFGRSSVSTVASSLRSRSMTSVNQQILELLAHSNSGDSQRVVKKPQRKDASMVAAAACYSAGKMSSLNMGLSRTAQQGRDHRKFR